MNILRKLDNLIFGKYKNQYGQELKKYTNGIDSLLDLGCGSNSPVSFIKNLVPYRVGVDLFEPSVIKSIELGIHNEYKLVNILEIDKVFNQNSFDMVIASDVIEHLEKSEGYKLLDLMEKIAKKRVIVLTPNGFLEQGVFDNNIYQIHKSGWEVEEFLERGYNVYGIMGNKNLRGEYSLPKIKPNFIGNRISYLTQDSTLNDPKKAFSIMCIKEVEKNN
jgi:hypothetical protein